MGDRVSSQRVARAGAALSLALAATVGPAAISPSASAGPGFGPEDCLNATRGEPGGSDIPWAQRRLNFERAQRFATGRGVTVAVVDSGIDPTQPQVESIDLQDPFNALSTVPALGYQPDDVRDCDEEGHGTGVTSIIAGQPSPGVGFVGLAPDVTIMPIKWDDPDTQDIQPSVIAAGIRDAVASPLGVDVINLSLSVSVDDPEVRAAVIDAGRADIVVVASSGNDTEEDENQISYPAAYASDLGPDFDHLIAVGAITEPDDEIASTSTGGAYVGVVAPGEAVLAPTSGGKAAAAEQEGYRFYTGTSFAAPFVSATAALVRERYPKMSAAEVVVRIKSTADRPGRSVPDADYGYGVVNPYLALTAARDDTGLEPPEMKLSPVAPPVLPEPPDRTLQNIAYGVSAGLLGAAGVFAIGSLAWRRTAAERRRLPEETQGGS